METGGTPAVCPCMIVWEHFKTRAQVAMRLPVCIHCTEQGEKGERHVTAGCAATYPGGYQTTRTGSARQVAGIVCPIPPWLPALQVVDLLQAAKAKVLVAPSPSVNQELWQKTEQVRRQVKSIALVLQVQGPGKERDAA